MASVVDICNRALDAIGEATIATLDDPSRQASLCKRYYPQVRDDVSRMFPWNCAIARAAINASGAPAWGAEIVYPLPADCLRVLSLDAGGNAVAQWRVEGTTVVTSVVAPLLVRYIRRLDDASLMDPLMVTAISARLAMELAMPITNDASLRELMGRELERAIAAAQRVTALEGSHLLDTRLTLCNQALAILGQDPILAVEDASRQARLCATLYPRVRSEILRAYPWNCITQRATISPSAAPAWGASTSYSLPVNCIRVLGIEPESGRTALWRVESGFILTDATGPLSIRYTALPTDDAALSPMVQTAIVQRLAMELCLPLTQSGDLRVALGEQALKAVEEAQRADAMEGSQDIDAGNPICNQAIALLAIDPAGTPALHAKAIRLSGQMYPRVRDEILRAYPWNCITQRVTIAASGAPAWGAASMYPLPAGYIRVLGIEPASGRANTWRVESGAILTDAVGPLSVRLTLRPTSDDALSAAVQTAIVTRLAMEMSLPLTQSGDLRASLGEQALRVLQEAQRADAMEGSQDIDAGNAICSQAIALLAIDETAAPELHARAIRLSGQIYARVRDDILRSYAWNCITERAQLGLEPDAVLGVSGSYELPPQCLRILNIEADSGRRYTWRVESGSILTRADGSGAITVGQDDLLVGRELVIGTPGYLWARYIKRPADDALIAPLIQTAIVKQMAAEMSLPVAKSGELQASLQTQAQNALAAAQQSDALEGSQEIETGSDICNQAVALLGIDPIANPMQHARATRLSGVFVDRAKDEVLRGHPWNCAIQRAEIVPSEYGPRWGTDTAYDLPADCLRVLSVDGCRDDRWRVEGSALVSGGGDKASILYVSRVDEGALDPALTAAVIARLAIDLATAIGSDKSMRQMLNREFLDRLRAARQADGAEGRTSIEGDDYLLRARL